MRTFCVLNPRTFAVIPPASPLPGQPPPPTVDLPERFLNPDNGLTYRPVPRNGSGGDIVTEWVPA